MTTINRLTSLERVKAWLSVNSNNDDVLLNNLIDECSRFILSYTNRPTLFQYIFSDIYDGVGNIRQMLRHYPVNNISLVMIDTVIIPASVNNGNGYLLEDWEKIPPGRPQLLSLKGYEFAKGNSNVNIVYCVGYVISKEERIIANSSIIVAAPFGSFGKDEGVTYSNNTALVKVTNNPLQGQYSVNNGVYSFNAADNNLVVKITYSYIPSDIEQACISLVGERYRYKNRIGEISKSLGTQETIHYSQKDMPDFVKGLLQPYKRVVLV
jgi:hypothetical protein